MKKNLKITAIKKITPDVLQINLERPEGIEFKSGQAADISINKPGWEDKLRAFTFTSLPEDNFLQFTIKTYPNHQGVTNEMLSLSAGDELIYSGTFGDIQYKGEGIFLAGGAGITPFLSIFKQLEKENAIGKNKLIFGNKTSADIIEKEQFEKWLGQNFINVLSDENHPDYHHGFIDEAIIQKYMENDSDEYFYLCGPDPMMKAVEQHILHLGVPQNKIVREQF